MVKSKESLYDKALNAKAAGLQVDLECEKYIGVLEKEKNYTGAAFAAEGFRMYARAMEIYNKIEDYEMAAIMAEKLNLKEEKLNFYKKEINKLLKKQDLSSAARVAETAELFEMATELHFKNNNFICAIKIAKGNNLEDILKKVGGYAIEDFLMEKEFKYAAYAAEAISKHEEAVKLFKKQIEIYEKNNHDLYAFVLREIIGLPQHLVVSRKRNTEDLSYIKKWAENCKKDIEWPKELPHLIFNKSKKLTKVYSDLDKGTSEEIKDLFELEEYIQMSFGLVDLAKQTKEN